MSAEAHFYLASALHGQGQLAAAQQAYQQCVALQPAHVDAWTGLAILAQQNKQPTLLADAEDHIKQLDTQAYAVLQQRLQETR